VTLERVLSEYNEDMILICTKTSVINRRRVTGDVVNSDLASSAVIGAEDLEKFFEKN